MQEVLLSFERVVFFSSREYDDCSGVDFETLLLTMGSNDGSILIEFLCEWKSCFEL